MYYAQNAIEGHFQEYVDFQDYVSDPSNQVCDLVDLNAIHTVPVTLIASIDDDIVPVEHSQKILTDIGYTQKHMWFVEGWTHRDFVEGKDDEKFVCQIDQTITYGTLVDFDEDDDGEDSDHEYYDDDDDDDYYDFDFGDFDFDFPWKLLSP